MPEDPVALEEKRRIGLTPAAFRTLQPRGDPGMSSSEDILLARLREGEAEAWEEFVGRHRRRIQALGYRMTGNAADAEEVLQETLLAFSRALPGFRGDASVSTYLYRTAVNAGIRVSEARARRPRGLNSIGDTAAPELPDPADREELLGRIRDAVLALPPRQRAVFTLRHYEGQGPARIAEILDLSEGAVKAHLHQAVSALRDGLRRHVPGEAGP